MNDIRKKVKEWLWLFYLIVSVQIAICIIFSLTVSHNANAAEFNIPSGDVNALINAINTANGNNEDDTINLEAGAYTLTEIYTEFNGLPIIYSDSNITINGAGAGGTIIERDDSGPDFRIFYVAGTLNIDGLTIRGGSGHPGGGIFNFGSMTITNSIVSNNNTYSVGGGIWNSNMMTITNSTISGNSANGGGGIYNRSDGTMIITKSAISDNEAIDTGYASSLGGGIANFGGMTITNSTFHSNGSQDRAGGILNWGGGITITNSTFSGNDAVTSGGIDNSLSGSVPLGTVELQNTILAENTASKGPDCTGEITSLGNNLIGDPSGCTITLHDSDLTGESGLGEFTDNGTSGNGHFPLLTSSQAIDAGNNDACSDTDQIGNPRPVDGDGDGIAVCDPGAIEFGVNKATICSTLGDDPKPSLLDQDIFKFEGTVSEEVTIRLEIDPSESHTGERATLILKDKIKGVRFFRKDRRALPNEITATLPATGKYLIIVAEQPKFARDKRFRGDYCLTLESSGEAWQTIEAIKWVE